MIGRGCCVASRRIWPPVVCSIRLSFPTARTFEQGLYVDGLNLSMSATVTFVSSMLNDRVRPKGCITGVVQGLEIGHVGGTDKNLRGVADWDLQK